MKKIKIGDVFSISTKFGNVLFQFVSETQNNCDLIRILPGFYKSSDMNYQDAVNLKERYFLHFPVQAALNRKLIELIGNYCIPEQVRIPRHFRAKNVHPKSGKVSWYIREENKNMMKHVDKLTDEIIAMSDWCVWNDTLLRERLEENWSLEAWK